MALSQKDSEQELSKEDEAKLIEKISKRAQKSLEQSGEKARLKQLLKKRLIEAGWDVEMTEYCQEVIRNQSLEHLDIDKLVQEIAPTSRAVIPHSIMQDMMSRITGYLENPAGQ